MKRHHSVYKMCSRVLVSPTRISGVASPFPLIPSIRYLSIASSSSPPLVPSVHITCHPGLEPFLLQEIQSILPHHHKDISLLPGQNRVHVKNMTQIQLLECCLRLGCATQIAVPLLDKPLHCRGFAELERKVGQLPWRKWISCHNHTTEDAPPQFRIHVSSSKSKLYHTAAITERMQRILANDHNNNNNNNIKVASPSPSCTSSKAPVVALQVQFHRDYLQLFLLARPFPLHQRGYRLETGKAPLREDLAYAMLWSAGVHNSSLYDAILDPFCGSGTLVLEAAAMVNGLPPGRLHDAPFSGTYLHKDDVWNSLKAERTFNNSRPIRVAGSDRDAGVIQAAQANAIRAGVEHLVTLQQGAFSSHPWLEPTDDDNDDSSQQHLLWISNLPFGKRTTTTTGRAGRVPALLPLYQKLVQHWQKNRHGTTAVLLTDNRSLLRRCGVWNEHELFQFSHGGIPVSVIRVMNSTNSCLLS